MTVLSPFEARLFQERLLSGVALGLLGAWLLTRLTKTLLFGVSAIDPLTFGGAALLLTLVALAACYAPARRATQIYVLITLWCG
jgi:putative ABC transport system permease protein